MIIQITLRVSVGENGSHLGLLKQIICETAYKNLIRI